MYPILIFDNQLNYIAQIDNYEYFRWTRRWRRPHDWEIQINRYKNNVQYLAEGNFIAAYRDSKYRIGRIAHKEMALTEEGKLSESWLIMGYDVSGVFNDRLCLHNTQSGNGYDQQNDVAENVMRHYVNVNAINPTDTNRKVPFLELGINLARGININTQARFQTLADVLESISLGSGLGYEVTFDINDQRFNFEVLEGKDLTPDQSENPPVIFSPEFDNVETLGYRWSELDSKTYAVVAGQGEAQTREIVEVQRYGESGFARREIFVDARDLANASQLTQRGEERLEELAGELAMEVEVLPAGPFTYLEDYNLGDIVHVRYPDVGSLSSRIIEVTEEYDETGESFRLVVGKEWPDLKGVLKALRRNTEVEVRR